MKMYELNKKKEIIEREILKLSFKKNNFFNNFKKKKLEKKLKKVKEEQKILRLSIEFNKKFRDFWGV